ncbi:MAG: hypothetical protein AAF581_11010 [Planctomycetota bacterium]
MKRSALELEIAGRLQVLQFPPWEEEYCFALEELGRRWRLDFAWVDERIALEVEGGTWQRGRHNRAPGYANDAEKYNAAIMLGWELYRVTDVMVKPKDGRADALLEKLKGRLI